MESGTLRVWWVPQVPVKMFSVIVPGLKSAHLMLTTLARYDTFQFENNIKPDYSNAGGLTIWGESLDADEDGEKWTDWYDDDGNDFGDFVENGGLDK